MTLIMVIMSGMAGMSGMRIGETIIGRLLLRSRSLCSACAVTVSVDVHIYV